NRGVLYSPVEQPERIDSRDTGRENNDSGENHPEHCTVACQFSEKTAYDHHNAACNKKLSAKPVGPIPVLLTVERPRKLDPYCVILLELWHIIAKRDEYDSNQHEGDHRDIDVASHRCKICDAVCHKRHNRDDPEYQQHWFPVNVFAFRIIERNHACEYMDSRQQAGQPEYSESFAGPSVCLAVSAPV